MTSLADLAAKISASKRKRDARTAAISQRVDDLDKRADTLLSQSETVNDDKDHELEELDASLNPDIGHNGSPDEAECIVVRCAPDSGAIADLSRGPS
jgi:hypothetical protein